MSIDGGCRGFRLAGMTLLRFLATFLPFAVTVAECKGEPDQHRAQEESAPFVTVIGDVRKPGKIEWTPELTVTKAVTTCGGPGWRYAHRAFVFRGGERISLSVAAIVRGKAPDVKLKPGDILDLTPRSFSEAQEIKARSAKLAK